LERSKVVGFQVATSSGKVSRLHGSTVARAQVAGFQDSKLAGFQGSKNARFQGRRVPRFQGSKVPGLIIYMVPRFQGCILPDNTPGLRELLGNYCVYIGNCISNFLMCKHFAPFKRNLNAALSGHMA